MNRKEVILKVIQDVPGISLSELMKETGLETGVITYYLRQLEEQGVIKSQKATKHRRYYHASVSEEEYPIIRNIRKPTKKQILFKIIVAGTPSFKELTFQVNKSPSTLSWNLSELIDDGVIEKCVLNDKVCYRVKDVELFKKTFKKEFSKLFDKNIEHAEDIFLAL
ncbi:MAG: winged helix-turn-helix transcriptional regulator [Candidatus Nitrosotenuis sp.]